MSSASSKVKTEYILPHTTSQENQPSPLALLAATCSRIGSVPTHEVHQQEGVSQQQQQQQTCNNNGPVPVALTRPVNLSQQPQIRIVNAAVFQQLQAAQQQQQAEGRVNKTNLGTPDRDSNLDLPVVGSLELNYKKAVTTVGVLF
uniref:(California timema) hypothetical protein n=1 Tax=Timema californicum TaxID=61474 RepID=A0A7R9PFY8_TIMCA|nr:unnamed protein product [Timema californicum]